MIIKRTISGVRETKLNKKFNLRGSILILTVLGIGGFLVFLYSGARKSSCLNRPLIGSYYYPWYTIQRWKYDRNVTSMPYLGPYDNSNLSVINQHIDWAKQAGIDYFIYSWLGTNKKSMDQKPKLLITLLGKQAK